MYRICTKNFDGTINRVLITHVFDTYENACEFISSRLDGCSVGDSGNYVIDAPITVRAQKEVKTTIISGRTADDFASFRPVRSYSADDSRGLPGQPNTSVVVKDYMGANNSGAKRKRARQNVKEN